MTKRIKQIYPKEIEREQFLQELRGLPITTSLYFDFIDETIKVGEGDRMVWLVEEITRIIESLKRHVNLNPTKKIYKFKQREDRREINISLRYDILNRDGFRCKLCGRNAGDRVKLHVDHIVAFVNGGKTRSDNLRTLCQDCNLGKKDKYEGN